MFSKNGWELKFQPMSDYHDKKILKHSGNQEKPNFYRNNKLYIIIIIINDTLSLSLSLSASVPIYHHVW